MNDWIQLEQVSQYFTTGSLGYKVLMGVFVLIAYRILKRIVNRAILNLATSKGVKKGPPEFYSALFQCRAAVFDRLCFCHYNRYWLWRCVIVPVVHFRRIGGGVYRAVVNSEQYHRQLFDLFCLPIPSGRSY